LRHWACAKIARAKPSAGDVEGGTNDDEVCDTIVKKFRELGGGSVSYAEIAKRAWEVGRAGLATKVGSYLHNIQEKMSEGTDSSLTMNHGHRIKSRCC
jgi:vacuolar protein sorting-associated protein 16